MDEPWRIQLFGGLRATQRERCITRFRTQKTGVLLAYLAYYRGRSHTREMLIEMLWPDGEAESGRHNLSLALSSLRGQLEPPGVPDGAVVVADRFSVELNPDAFVTDVQEFEEAVRRAAQARNAPDRTALLSDAAELYGGALLPGFYEDWVVGEQERLAQRYAQTVIQLISSLEQEGRAERALAWCQRAAPMVPLHEEVQRELMRLLAEAGDLDAALRHYRELTRLLFDELAEEPSGPTRRLAREIEGRLEARPAAVSPIPRPAPAQDAPRPAAAPAAPAGTVTFLFTDIVGSTALWEQAGEAFRAALALHHALLRREFRRFGGYEAKEAGDSFIVAFHSASDGLACAVACQRALAGQEWPRSVADGEEHPLAIMVRMALHTGDVDDGECEYRGLVLHRGARVLAAAHGGQVLCSEATTGLLRRDLESDVGLRDLGVYRLRGIELPERLFQVDYPGMPATGFPPPSADPAHQAHLPMQFTRFFGREEALADLQALLSPAAQSRDADDLPTRLVTLTGPGGSGKTRLAIEAAGRLADVFAGAVWFVPLADLPEPTLLLGAIVDSLCVPRDPNVTPLQQAVTALSRQPSLLVLDNFEHLVGADSAGRPDAASAVGELLGQVPGLRVLVTSRHLLTLAGEREFLVSPLRTPGSNTDAADPAQLSAYESVRLFVDRAQAVKPDFRITNQNAPAVAELCDRLEGLPLAIELAAARALVLTPQQMLAQLANRFEFLVSRKRGVSERQRTLRAAIDWSYRLLAPDQQRLFARLSVFRGGWTVEAAEEVCAEPLALDFLAEMREGSLVQTDACPTCGSIRFRLLEMLREYAAERLAQMGDGGQDALQRRHAEYYLRLAEEAEPHLTGPDQTEWLERLQAERDNLRAVLAWCAHAAPADPSLCLFGLRLACAVWRFWSIRGYSRDGRMMVERLLSALPPDGPGGARALRARALDAAGALAHDMSDFAGAESLLAESLAFWRRAGDGTRLAHTLNLLANVALDRGREVEAVPLYEEALTLYRSLGDRRGTAMVLSNLGALAVVSGEPERAAACLDESLHLKRALGNQYSLAIGLENLGNVERSLGNLDRAVELHSEALGIRRALGHKAGIAMSCSNLGQALVLMGRREQFGLASISLREALGLFQELGDQRGLAECLANCAGLAARMGRIHDGWKLAGAAAALRTKQGIELTAGDSAADEALRAVVRRDSGDGPEKAERQGARMTAEQAAELGAAVCEEGARGAPA